MENIKVVIVDDSPFSISVIRDILELEGLEVVGVAGTLEEVRAVVKDKRPQLVTMDMTLPGTNGLECTRAIHEIDSNIKVIVVSSMMDDEIIKNAKKNKVVGYVQKPIDPEELIGAIEKVMFNEKLYKQLDDMYLNIFKEAFSGTLNRFTKTIADFGKEEKTNQAKASMGVSICMGIIGTFSGRLIIDLSNETANSIARFILKRDPKDMNETLSFMAEFSNIVGGNACSMINRKNKIFALRVAPANIFYGESLSISQAMLDSTSVESNTEFGEIYLNVGFKRGINEWI